MKLRGAAYQFPVLGNDTIAQEPASGLEVEDHPPVTSITSFTTHDARFSEDEHGDQSRPV